MHGKSWVRSAAIRTGIIVILGTDILAEQSLFIRILAALLLVYTVVELLQLVRDRRRDSASAEPAVVNRADVSNGTSGPGYVEVLMPSLGEYVESAVILRWMKTAGETVEVGEPIVEISTDKVDTEVPSPATGVLESIFATASQAVAVGAPMAVISPAIK